MLYRILAIITLLIILYLVVLMDVIMDSSNIHKMELNDSVCLQLKTSPSTIVYSANSIERDHTDLGDCKIYKFFIRVPADISLLKSQNTNYLRIENRR